MKVSIIQSSLHWQNREANLNMFEEKINSFSDKTDLIVLPEMFTTGFTMDAESKLIRWRVEANNRVFDFRASLRSFVGSDVLCC